MTECFYLHSDSGIVITNNNVSIKSAAQSKNMARLLFV